MARSNPTKRGFSRRRKKTRKHRPVGDAEQRILKVSRQSFRNKNQRARLGKIQRVIRGRMKQQRRRNRDPDAPVQQPTTVESRREEDESIITEDVVSEVREDETFDEFASYFRHEERSKVLITTGHKGFLQLRREKPPRDILRFVRDMLQVIPRSYYFDRKHYRIKEIIDFAVSRGFTFLMVVGDLHRKPYNLILSHLPVGPTMSFRISSYVHSDHIRDRAKFNDYFPELILNNFTTRLGLRVGRMLSALFPQEPEFLGRRVVTLHNQRDFVFFRHHRYQFEASDDVILQEIGPEFTLRVMWIQLGTFDPRYSEYEWFYNRFMDTSKRRLFL